MSKKLEALQQLQAVKQARLGRCAPSTCIFTSGVFLP
jgi:hypothetical protein